MNMSLLLDCYKGCERVTLWLGLDTKTAWLGKGKDQRVMLCSFSTKPTSNPGLPQCLTQATTQQSFDLDHQTSTSSHDCHCSADHTHILFIAPSDSGRDMPNSPQG